MSKNSLKGGEKCNTYLTHLAKLKNLRKSLHLHGPGLVCVKETNSIAKEAQYQEMLVNQQKKTHAN